MIITHNGTILTNDGVVLNNIITSPSPSFSNDYSFEFDGTDDKVITNSAIVGSDITLSGWYNLNAASYTAWQYQFATCIAPSNSSASNAALGKFYKRGSQMEIGVQAYDQNSANYSTYAVRVQLEGAGWNHVVWTYNDTTKHIYCYLNGVAQTWTNYGGTITTPYLTGNPTHLYGSNLIMGAISPTSTTGFFSGLLDEVSTYDRILTPSEITGIYNGGTPNDLTSLSPYGWWRNGDNSLYKDPQWLLPSNENKDKVSNYSMSLDGTDDRIDIGTALNLGTDSTISMWIKRGRVNTLEMLLGEDTNSFDWMTYIDTSNNLLFKIGTAGLLFNNSPISTILNDTTNWINICFVRTGNSVELFLNGVSMQIRTGFGTLVDTRFDTIGAKPNGTFPFLGNIDEVAAWNTNTIIPSDIYNLGTPTDLTSLNPISWYRMGDDATFSTNWTVPDQVGSNDGTSANMDINDRIGDAPGSSGNALSYNMVLSGRTTDVPT